MASLHWWIDHSRSPEEKSQQIPLSDRLLSRLDPTFRFIWVLHFKPTLVNPVIPGHCDSTSRASLHYSDLKLRLFPDEHGKKIWISPEVYLMSQTFQAIHKKPSPDDINSPESKSLFSGLAPHFKNQIKFAQVEASDIALPQTLPPAVVQIFKQKKTTTFLETLLVEVFPPILNCCIILFGQVAILQRYRLRWRSEGMPGGFSPFSFDPHATPGLKNNNALDNEIRQKIHEASISHLNDLIVRDIHGIYSDSNLHFPSTDFEFEIQLHSFLCLIKGLFGSNCFMASQVERVLQNFYKFKP